jgi:hypothetical protein
MEYRFKAEDWESLTPENRARRCRLLAEEARALASRAPPHLKHSYLHIAEDWMMLAIDIEKAATGKSRAN